MGTNVLQDYARQKSLSTAVVGQAQRAMTPIEELNRDYYAADLPVESAMKSFTTGKKPFSDIRLHR
jgi:hypothetical protein